ncbi:MAG: hypothetical protein AAGA58_01230 [Verrucomicrobiota bacterium]
MNDKNKDEEEFFIGWQGKAPEKTGRDLRVLVVGGLLAALGLAVAIPLWQKTVPKDAAWDYEIKEFTGVLLKEPAPVLVGDEGAVWFLVNEFKFGFDAEVAEEFHLKRVSLEGSLISRDGQVMIEAFPQTVKDIGGADGTNPLGEPKLLGEISLQGEIVDSKCYLGVMTPGNLKPHRACAINCISGGIPPVLVVRDQEGVASYFLLVGAKGEAINQEVLPLVAEPVEMRGRLWELGPLKILRTNPSTISIVES